MVGFGLCHFPITLSGASSPGSTLGSKPPSPACARFIMRRLVALFLASRGPGARPTFRLGTLPRTKRCVALLRTCSLIQILSFREGRRSGRQQTCLLKDIWSINWYHDVSKFEPRSGVSVIEHQCNVHGSSRGSPSISKHDTIRT